MSEKTEAQVAFADALITVLWTKGLITLTERKQISEKTAEGLRAGKC